MNLLPHQKKAAKKLKRKLSRYGMAILSGEPRSGKTLSFLEAVKDYSSPLIITQKSAIADIQSHTSAEVVNFHQVKKCVNNYDIIVIDEAHRWVTGYPKRSTIWKEVRGVTEGKPVIFSSGTLTPEGYSGLFNMLALCDSSPWSKYPRFTLWHEDYGRPYSMRINGYTVQKYDRTKEEKVLKDVKKYTVSITREKAGHKYEAEDHPVIIPLNKQQKRICKKLGKDLLLEQEEGIILADTPAKLLTKMHQISGGFCKGEDLYELEVEEKPKLKWLRENIDPRSTIILSHYRNEQEMLSREFPNTGSITKNAEGIDFSHFETMVIYSMSFSAATYEQVRARQMNFSRKTPIKIIYLLSGIDEYVYKAVHAKKNFTNSWYKKVQKVSKAD